MRYELESIDKHRYHAFFVSPLGRIRLGQVLGSKGKWFAHPKGVGASLGPFRTRGQAAKALAGEKFNTLPSPRTGTAD